MKKKSRFKIDVLRAITDVEFIKLMNENKLIEIAEKFNTCPSSVSKEISSRNLYYIKEQNRSRKVNFKAEKKHFLILEEELPAINSWTNSPERYSFVNAGLMSNK